MFIRVKYVPSRSNRFYLMEAEHIDNMLDHDLDPVAIVRCDDGAPDPATGVARGRAVRLPSGKWGEEPVAPAPRR